MTQAIIAFTGLAGSGKSTAAKYLIYKHEFVNGKFARALKEMTRAYLRYRRVEEEVIERMIEGDLKELPSDHMMQRSPRYWMQKLGTEFGRDLVHKDIWVDTEMAHIEYFPRVVFDDARFPNEVEAIRSAGGKLVEIRNPNLTVIQESNHESEAHRFDPDHVLINDGSIDDLYDKLDYWVAA